MMDQKAVDYIRAEMRECIARFLYDLAWATENEEFNNDASLIVSRALYDAADQVRDVPHLGASEIPVHHSYVEKILAVNASTPLVVPVIRLLKGGKVLERKPAPDTVRRRAALGLENVK